MAELRLTEAQARAVAHRGGDLLISAGAGSGKTRVLVERLLALIAEGGDLDRFLIITYTRAAAAELRGRILASLRERLREGGSEHLQRQLLLLPQARIGTIHSFCASVLRENAQMLEIRPDFRQLEGAEEQLLRAETLQELLADRYETMSPGFQALAEALSSGESDQILADTVLETYNALQSHPDPDAWLERELARTVSFDDAGETVWGEALLAQARRLAAFWQQLLSELLERLQADPPLEKGYAPALRGALDELDELTTALSRGWDAAAAAAADWLARGFGSLRGARGRAEDPTALLVKSRWEDFKTSIKKLAGRFEEDSAAHREDMAAVAPVTGELLTLVRDFSAAFAAEKRRRGLLDFFDLEHLALRLLTETDGAGRLMPSPLGREIGSRYQEILVDEYQDCNRVQDQIFDALSRSGGSVTAVGDVKQSIYRFRLADPTLFLQKYRSYADEPRPGQGRRVLLPENFRSDRGILRPVNEFFSAVMSRELGELDYGPAEQLLPGPDAPDTEGAFRLFVSDEASAGGEREEDQAARYAAWLLQSGMTVPEGNGRRPLRPGDIALLLRKASGRDGAYAEALKRRGIPAVCMKAGEDPSARPSVRWALSLLQIIDNPRQDIPLLTALRSPVFRFSEDRLAEVRCFRRHCCYYEALAAAAETEADCRAVLLWLARWRERSFDLPAEELLEELCAETGLRALAEAGEEGASAHLDALIAEAHGLAGTGRQDLYSFVTALREAGETKKTAVSAQTGGEGVVITTVHGAKGLEYPVVILTDLMKKFNLRDLTRPLLVHPELGVGVKRTDRRRGITWPTLPRLAIGEELRSESLSEELRVLYVAMTRAKRHLALFCRVKNLAAARRDYAAGTALPLPPELLQGVSCPGAWLLTASLALGGEGDWAWQTPPGADHWRPPEEARPEAPAIEAEALRARLDWRYARPADPRLPSKLTATALRSGFAAAEAAEGAEALPRRHWGERDFPALTLGGGAELSPAEKGSAMHLALQYADLDRCTTPEGTAEALAELGRLRILTEAQLAAVDPAKLQRFCLSPELALLRRGQLHREFKFSLLAPLKELLGEGEGETLLQGVVDLWSELPEGLLLLDYKTDRVSRESQADRAEEYLPQLRAYAWALERITGKKVLRCFLWFFATGESVELTLPERGEENG